MHNSIAIMKQHVSYAPPSPTTVPSPAGWPNQCTHTCPLLRLKAASNGAGVVKTSGYKKLSRPKSSTMLFCSGVPVAKVVCTASRRKELSGTIRCSWMTLQAGRPALLGHLKPEYNDTGCELTCFHKSSR